MAIPSSQSTRSESEIVPHLRPVMPVDLFRAVMKGDRNVLIQRLGLQLEEQKEIQVTIEDSPSAPQEVNTENQTVQSDLQSATRSGDTILHLLITKGHNELALKVFQRDMSLLKARNYMLETPLYCAAKVGNEKVIHNLIQSDRVVVKDALLERKENGDTAMHVAAQLGHTDIVRLLMNLDPELAYKVNDEMKSPFYMAIIEGCTPMVQTMLEVDPNLACTPFSDGMFPVHVAACEGYQEILNVFIEDCPDDAEFQDSRGRNFFHIAAEKNWVHIFSGLFEAANFKEKREKMITATNYEGDTPFHIAARKGHTSIMRAIWEHYQVAGTVRNKKGWTPLELSAKQVKTREDIDDDMIDEYLKTHEDYKFTRKWFDDVMEPPLENKWERTQVIGLGSVLITTVTFAAAFTIPGGYNQDHGTPVLGKRYMFQAFILANALAFIHGFLSLFALLMRTLNSVSDNSLVFSTISFLMASSSMVVAFGLGLYVTLAPVCYPIAVLLLVITILLGSPAVIFYIMYAESILGPILNPNSFLKGLCYVFSFYAMSFLFIFCLALM